MDLNLADTFVLFLALAGPQKVLLSFARLGRVLDVRNLRLVAWTCSLAAACVGVLCALSAPWIATFFHISPASVGIAAGLTFFVYSVGLVLGFHFDSPATLEAETGGPDVAHPLISGFREMLVPFVVSPLAIAADLLESLTANDWAHRLEVAGAFVAVAAVNLIFAWALAPVMRRMHEIVLDVLSRLLGVLLAAVGAELFLQGLAALGVLPGGGGHLTDSLMSKQYQTRPFVIFQILLREIAESYDLVQPRSQQAALHERCPYDTPSP